MTWYEAKGILEAVFDRLSLTVSYEKDAEDARFHPGLNSIFMDWQTTPRYIRSTTPAIASAKGIN
jgi:hypothetical protein